MLSSLQIGRIVSIVLPDGFAAMVDRDLTVQRGDHRPLHRRRHHHPGVLAHLEQIGDQRRIAGDEPSAIAGEIRRFGQRMHGEQTGVIAPADSLVENRHRVGIPGQTQVALVGCDDGTTLARELDHLAQVIHAEGSTSRIRG